MYKNNNQKNYVYFKYFFFLIFLFPFTMHIYWGIFDILYANNIMFVAFFLMLGILILNLYELKIKKINDKSLFLSFAFFLLIFLINSFLLNDYKDLIKYTLYFIIFYLLLSKYLHDNYLIFYINIITTFVLINLILYFDCFVFPFQSFFIAKKLSLLTMDSSFLIRSDWEYSIPFYLIVFPINSLDEHQVGLFGIPRLFGMSEEPTLYSVVVLPTIIMALFFKKYIQGSILIVALLLSSSFGVMGIGLVGVLFYIFYRYKLFIFFVLVALFFLGYFLDLYQILSTFSPRLKIYMGLVMNIFHLSSLSFLANHNFNNIEELKLPSAFLSDTLKFGLLQGATYLFIVYVYIKFTLKTHNKLLFVFSVVSLLLLNKSGEIISPLFLFYLSFIYTQYLKLNYNEN